jgi:hypothetical protein
MIVTINFSGYNFRRYSRPWIARVIAWPIGGRATLTWGTFLGNDAGGAAEIEAEPGDVIRYGQKDYRKAHNSSAEWALVLEDGSHQDIDELTAARAFRAKAEAKADMPAPTSKIDIDRIPKIRSFYSAAQKGNTEKS